MAITLCSIGKFIAKHYGSIIDSLSLITSIFVVCLGYTLKDKFGFNQKVIEKQLELVMDCYNDLEKMGVILNTKPINGKSDGVPLRFSHYEGEKSEKLLNDMNKVTRSEKYYLNKRYIDYIKHFAEKMAHPLFPKSIRNGFNKNSQADVLGIKDSKDIVEQYGIIEMIGLDDKIEITTSNKLDLENEGREYYFKYKEDLNVILLFMGLKSQIKARIEKYVQKEIDL